MGSGTDKIMDIVLGVVGIVVAATVIVGQNAETLGSTLNYLVVGFIPLFMGIALLRKASLAT